MPNTDHSPYARIRAEHKPWYRRAASRVMCFFYGHVYWDNECIYCTKKLPGGPDVQ